MKASWASSTLNCHLTWTRDILFFILFDWCQYLFICIWVKSFSILILGKLLLYLIISKVFCPKIFWIALTLLFDRRLLEFIFFLWTMFIYLWKFYRWRLEALLVYFLSLVALIKMRKLLLAFLLNINNILPSMYFIQIFSARYLGSVCFKKSAVSPLPF